MFKNYADVDTLATQEGWRKMSESERLDLIKQKISEHDEFEVILPTRSQEGGQVSIIINDLINAGERGTLLLNLEEFLKSKIDNGISIWHKAIGDKSSLRNLRGIEVL